MEIEKAINKLHRFITNKCEDIDHELTNIIFDDSLSENRELKKILKENRDDNDD